MVADKDKNAEDPYLWYKAFVSGGVAGMTSKTTVAPLDRMKILLQVHNTHYKHLGVFSGLKSVVKNESISGLYRGNGAQMVRIFPYAAIQFVAFEAYKKALNQTFGAKTSSGKPRHIFKFISGSAAGVTAAMCTYPLDLIRARLAYEVTMTGAKAASSTKAQVVVPKFGSRFKMVAIVRHIMTHEGGITGLYRGLTPTLIAMVPYAGTTFYVFERLKYIALEMLPSLCAAHHRTNNETQNNDELVLNVPSKLACGAFAGAIAQVVSYPLDVTRRRMQLSMTSPETVKYGVSVRRTLILVYQEHGLVRGLYRGMSINFLRACPMVAVSFSSYELMKQWLGMETGIADSSANTKAAPAGSGTSTSDVVPKKRDVL